MKSCKRVLSLFISFCLLISVSVLAAPVTRDAGGLLPRLFTLVPRTERSFSVTLPHPRGRLPVRKHDALCCPDFPLSLSGQR